MFRKASGVVGAIFFILQTTGFGGPMDAAPAAGHQEDRTANPPLASETAEFDANRRRASLAGLDVFLSEDYRGPLPVAVTANCFGQQETPALAVDATTYGANARLLNVTKRSERGCNSYEVTIVAQNAGPAGAVAPVAGPAPVPDGIAISVPYMPLRSPDGRLKDPAVFVFNPVHGNWTEAKPFAPAVPEPQRVYATLAEHHQRIIGGVIALPDSLQSEPARTGPSSLAKPLEQVNPLNGYLSVDKIEPDSKGAYTVNLPLLLRPSRGPGPSFSIRYNSQGAPGVLGRGWDLFISTIEVRGPAPIYHPGYETEDYVLDGMDLIALDANGTDIPPLYKGGPIIPRVSGMRFFRLRNNSDGLIVRRYGDGPNAYFWEVWNPNSHVTRLYGGELGDNPSAPRLSKGNGLLRGTATFGDGRQSEVVGQWGLTLEYDNQPARNGARYEYEPSGCIGSWGGGCAAALRLHLAEYNLAFAATQIAASGVTRVGFTWTARPDPARFNSDGRLGFFRAQEFWLASLEVRYRPDQSNLWLVSLPSSDALFARHTFKLEGDNACMNYDMLFKSYVVEANSSYDVGTAPEMQTFKFDYEGEKYGKQNNNNCSRPWNETQHIDQFGKLPAGAIDGGFGFPSGLLDNLGFGLLAGRSLLGTGQTQETGASLYVGVGPVGNPASKEITFGVKAGVNFTNSVGTSTLVDITGDGIDDIVYRDGGGLRYCAGERDQDYHVRYRVERCGTIEGISDFSLSSTSTGSVGVEAVFAGDFFFGIGYNSSNNQTYVYFTDRDGDGLVDLVAYGQVFYNQGETAGNVVRFAPNSALIPPIPGVAAVAEKQVKAHTPVDLRRTIQDIEARLDTDSRRLHALQYSQTTIAWEAPLDGIITIAGELRRGSSQPESGNAGALGDFGPQQFRDLRDEVHRYQEYIDAKFTCVKWPEDPRCYESYADPFGPHYAATKANIEFLATPDPWAQISLYRREAKTVVPCASGPFVNDVYDLGAADFAPACRPNDGPPKQIQVKTGDVLYLTYSVHPHLRAWIKPKAKIAYARVDDDAAFNLIKAGDPQKITDALNCKWKDELGSGTSGDCLLSKQTRYEFDLRAGAITSAPTVVAEVPLGSGRTFGGRFTIPADLTVDYQVFFDVMAEVKPAPVAGAAPPASSTAPPASALRRLFRQDVSALCTGVTGSCTVDINPQCDPLRASADCTAFSVGPSAYFLAARLTIEHRTAGVALPVRNVSARLSDMTWLAPPSVTSVLTEQVTAPPPGKFVYQPSAFDQAVVVYLPVAMGEPDSEYLRIEQGKFANPDQLLNDDGPPPATIDFKTLLAEEKLNVELARIRQTIGLCGFADEIREFLSSHFSESGEPYATEYVGYWDKKIAVYKDRCAQSRQRLADKDFTAGNPKIRGTNGLRLPEVLQNLPYGEQVTSAETLLERVLRNLALGEDFLTDAPRLTRRGYRLPVKVNPLDCKILSSLAWQPHPAIPIDAPIYGPEDTCAYRLSANFAMQEFEEVMSPADAKNLRAVLDKLLSSAEPAFRIELTATVNGRPVPFHELSGEKTGNDNCTPPPGTPRTCLGSYGTIEPISDYFYPKVKPGGNPNVHGDAFPRITNNKRAGRAVAFTNSIMDLGLYPKCPRSYPPNYGSLGEMEAKQDCLVKGSDLTENEKYTGPESYTIEYTIGENNQFFGRNRVFEIRANPLDVVELHFRLAGVERPLPRAAPNSAITGRFSTLDAGGGDAFMIPRSPSQILLPENELSLSCPSAAGIPASLPARCRPWTRLGWTEVLLGAQYRTYSDAQTTRTADLFSIIRRRELLRLHPEIEVDADKYALDDERPNAPKVSQIPMQESLAFDHHDPNVPKTGADWAFFARRAANDGSFQLPAPFMFPAGTSVRYALSTLPHSQFGSDEQNFFNTVSAACGDKDHPHPDACKDSLGTRGDDTLNLKGYEYFALVHRFVGPSKPQVLAGMHDAGAARPEISVCAAEIPTATASCWIGMDDTVFLEAAVSGDNSPANPAPLYSVSALVGFERPPVAQFVYDFKSYKRLGCLDPASPSVTNPSPPDLCALPSVSMPAPAGEFRFPNRPTPPDPSRAVQVFAPVQSSESSSLSLNAGVAQGNADYSNTSKRSTRVFQDVNGDGFPDFISDGTVELTSPVGLSRRDWWRYFRARDDIPGLDTGLQAGGFQPDATSVSAGVGFGQSPPTFAVPKAKGSYTDFTNSPDANVQPAFSFNLETGHDIAFSELRDFNGDGLADHISATAAGVDPSGLTNKFSGLTVQYNAGNGLGPQPAPLTVGGGGMSGFYFNSSHSAGFGVRLGFSYGANSFLAGLGLAHRDTGSHAALIDFTGDGRPDIVLPGDKPGTLIVFPNLGNGFGPGKMHNLGDWTELPQADTDSGTALSESTLVDGGAIFTIGFNFVFVRVVVTPGVKLARGQTRELLGIRDLNGDGVPDIVTVSGAFLPSSPGGGGAPTLDPGSVKTKVHYNPEGKYHFLTGITNPSGSQWVLQQGLFGNSGPEHGRPVWALTAVARYDGYIPSGVLPAHGQDILLTRYDYSGGYFNRAERQFYGFAKRTSEVYGCDFATTGGTRCLEVIRDDERRDPASLKLAGYRLLQVVDQTFSNRDFLTQGMEVLRTVSGVNSPPVPPNASANPTPQAVSRTVSAYSIDDLVSLTNAGNGACMAPAPLGSKDSWTAASFSFAGSALSADWNGSNFHRNGKVFGPSSICGSDVGQCARTLAQNMCNEGFVREQSAFWAQQSGSVRQRFIKLETFGDVPASAFSNPSNPDNPDDPADAARLRSAVAFDHDQWGQVLAFDSIAEASAAWVPAGESSANAAIIYAPRDLRRATGYPILGLAQEIQIFAGPWSLGENPAPLRAREALYSDDGRGNLTDVCLYPGGTGFAFTRGMCGSFKGNMRAALDDRYSTLESALRAAYDKTGGLPKGQSVFNAIVHHQLVEYDDFGNLTHAVSPLSQNKEWIERRFDYKGDPLRRRATATELTRCVNDIPGAGIDSANLEPLQTPRCTFGLTDLPKPVLRKAVTHGSQDRIDTHFGVVAETTDINGNSLRFDFDRWGRLGLIARSWGNAPRENKTFHDRLDLALKKVPFVPDPRPNEWRLLALVDYGRVSDGLLRSNVRRFESSDIYSGLLREDKTIRETASFADGLGRAIQSVREADVCLAAAAALIDGTNTDPTADLKQRCSAVATGIATPASRIDALGRDLQSFESYAIDSGPARPGTNVRFTDLFQAAPNSPIHPYNVDPLVSTTYDGAGRPLLVESRLAHSDTNFPDAVQGTTQYRYRVVPEMGERLARFEALSLSPRCTASATWSDARGLKRTVFEDQQNFYAAPGPAPLAPAPGYQRDPIKTRGYCAPIESMAVAWAEAAGQSEQTINSQPARVSYVYDPLQQLFGVDSPLSDSVRAGITARYDLLGRTLELQDPDSGCTRYAYDGLNSLMAETGFRSETDATCGTSSQVRNEKSYTYSGGRLVRMSYHSLEEQGGPPDQRDHVRYYYDRYPHAALFGEVLEALRFVPNDQANQRFVDVTGRKCENCIGQITLVSDRTGARAFSYDELGLARREVRSIVAPLRDVKASGGNSETVLPEAAFYELENSYSAFGDPVQEKFSESAPMNPADACVGAGVETCLARFSIGRKYAPDGAIAQFLFNGKPLMKAAQDALGRPAVRWTANGIATGYRYDGVDLRLNQMTTVTAANVPVQVDGYQYDGGGNILNYANVATAVEDYETGFGFNYDPVNRLIGFEGAVRKGAQRLQSHGAYQYDSAHRFTRRDLSITGTPGTTFQRNWAYSYRNDPLQGPVHAPQSIAFAINDLGRTATFAYDDVGRMTRVGSDNIGREERLGLLSNRALTWDAEGRLIRVRGVADGVVTDNEDFLREDYVYDAGGNRALRIHRPLLRENDRPGKERDSATIYMTPFYARPFDRRGTVQLSQGSLPAASLTAPADQSEDPVATFLYSDLPVGSMTAGVTVFGEASDANATVIARREYSPYGLELTSDRLADIGRPGVAPLSVFHGKELDRVTGFSSFGARYYSRDIGLWLRPDPMMSSYLSGGPNKGVYAARNLSAFSYGGHNPIRASDPDGSFITAVLDVGFIVYDIGALVYDEIKTGGVNRTENTLALGLDVGSLAIPFVAGAGLAVRGGAKVTEHAATTIVHGFEGIKRSEAIGKAGETLAEALANERKYEIVGKQMHVILENDKRMIIDLLAKKGDKYFAIEVKAGETSLLRKGGQDAFYFEGVGIKKFSGKKTESILLEKNIKQQEIIDNLTRVLQMQ
jgi:RHS repeat-associated protein